MVSTGGGIVIAILVLLIVGAVGWVVFSQLRARRLGLPPPSLSSYLPWRKSDSPYGPPRPARGGVVGWFNDLVRKFKHRNNRSAAGAYEQPLHGGGGGGGGGGATRGNRGFGPLDPDDAWDARVGHEADTYGYYGYEEQELGIGGGGGGGGTEYGGSGYNSNGGGDRLDDEERGRQMNRGAGAGSSATSAAAHGNPFDDDAAASLRGVSPRPMDAAARGPAGHGTTSKPTTERPGSAGSNGHGERRSIFRENV